MAVLRKGSFMPGQSSIKFNPAWIIGGAICFVVFIFVLACGSDIGRYYGRLDAQQEACDLGLAEWGFDGRGQPEFKWKTDLVRHKE